MEIVSIYDEWLYSIQFDEEDLTEYVRVFKEWHNLDYLVRFFSDNSDFINTRFKACKSKAVIKMYIGNKRNGYIIFQSLNRF